MVRIVLRISRLAKIAVTVTMIGGAVALYGKTAGDARLNGIGSILFIAGLLGYVIERFRSSRRARD